jgi:hypothetical protein
MKRMGTSTIKSPKDPGFYRACVRSQNGTGTPNRFFLSLTDSYCN